MKTYTAASFALLALLAATPAADAQRGFIRISDDGVSLGASFGKDGHRSGRSRRYDRRYDRRQDRRDRVGFGLHIGHRHGPACGPVIVPGRYEHRRVKVWVPGYNERVHVPARYDTRNDRWGRPYRVCVSEAYYRDVWHPGTWTWRNDRVWVDGYTRYSCGY